MPSQNNLDEETVGDSYGYDVIGAQRAGLRPIFLDRAGAYDAVDFARIRSLRELVLDDAVAWRDGVLLPSIT